MIVVFSTRFRLCAGHKIFCETTDVKKLITLARTLQNPWKSPTSVLAGTAVYRGRVLAHGCFRLFSNDFVLAGTSVFRCVYRNTRVFVCFPIIFHCCVYGNTPRVPEHEAFSEPNRGNQNIWTLSACTSRLAFIILKGGDSGMSWGKGSTLYWVPLRLTGNRKNRKNFMSGTVSIF